MNTESIPEPDKFTLPLLDWFGRYGRKTLPWQRRRDPYPVWVSEIMLQQTQVETVIPYFERFIARFPDVGSLADAELDDVMPLWAGLGYYARARNLHSAAQKIRNEHHGIFPDTLEQVMALPGIGRSTAGAILAFCSGQRHPILDGNVKRVLSRYLAIPGYPGDRSIQDRLWQAAERFTPEQRVADYTQAIMDLGALVCTRKAPSCSTCPVTQTCSARIQGNIQDYPGRKPRSPRPKRKSVMMLVRNDAGEFLLVKRPPSGIWGGLWSLPEIPCQDDDHRGCYPQELHLAVGPGTPLDPVLHGFTHFELEMLPMLCQLIDHADNVMDAGEYLWYNPQGDEDVAMPAAMKKIFKQLEKTKP